MSLILAANGLGNGVNHSRYYIRLNERWIKDKDFLRLFLHLFWSTQSLKGSFCEALKPWRVAGLLYVFKDQITPYDPLFLHLQKGEQISYHCWTSSWIIWDLQNDHWIPGNKSLRCLESLTRPDRSGSKINQSCPQAWWSKFALPQNVDDLANLSYLKDLQKYRPSTAVSFFPGFSKRSVPGSTDVKNLNWPSKLCVTVASHY